MPTRILPCRFPPGNAAAGKQRPLGSRPTGPEWQATAQRFGPRRIEGKGLKAWSACDQLRLRHSDLGSERGAIDSAAQGHFPLPAAVSPPRCPAERNRIDNRPPSQPVVLTQDARPTDLRSGSNPRRIQDASDQIDRLSENTPALATCHCYTNATASPADCRLTLHAAGHVSRLSLPCSESSKTTTEHSPLAGDSDGRRMLHNRVKAVRQLRLV